jgi:hypothetical protein
VIFASLMETLLIDHLKATGYLPRVGAKKGRKAYEYSRVRPPTDLAMLWREAGDDRDRKAELLRDWLRRVTDEEKEALIDCLVALDLGERRH